MTKKNLSNGSRERKEVVSIKTWRETGGIKREQRGNLNRKSGLKKRKGNGEHRKRKECYKEKRDVV